MKKRKLRLIVLFISTLSIFFIIMSILSIYSSTKVIEEISDIAVHIDNKNNRALSAKLFYDITVNTARHWSGKLEQTNNVIEMFGNIVHKQLTSSKKYKDKVNLTSYKGRNFFVDTSQNIFTAFYWGNPNHVPQHITNKLTSLKNIINIFSGIKNLDPEIYHDVYVVSTNCFAFSYPQLKQYYKNIKNCKFYNDYYRFPNFPSQIMNKDIKVIMPCKFIKPYRDYSGFVSITAKTGIYNKGKLLGYVGIDLNFEKIKKIMLESKLSKSFINNKKDTLKSFFFLLDAKGYIITFPEEYADLFSIPKSYLNMKYLLKTNTVKLSDSANPEIKTLCKKIKNNNSGLKHIIINNQDYMVAYSTIEVTGWKLGYVIKNKTLLQSAIGTKKLINSYIRKATNTNLFGLIIFIVFSFFALFMLFRYYIENPLKKIIEKVKKVGDGNFNIRLEEKGIDEIVELSSTFNYMGKQLNDYMENLKNETMARLDYETEIKIAENIQKSILPDSTNLPTHSKFEIVAKLNAAKNVSGDFYDFFYINENTLAILIADVSGKGLPAAFFMAMSKILIKNQCLQKPMDPGEVFTKANHALCLDNKSQMFTTATLAFYNIDNGTIKYTNAGHHQAIFVKNSKIARAKKISNIALGVLDDYKYESGSAKFDIGEMALNYTDGVPEAISPDGKEYGEDRLEGLILKNSSLSLKKLCNLIIDDVLRFEDNRRFDDITLIAIKRLK
ncbi:MAG: SpoIIE family protein phosphatase [bacterium]|nr:SpoIIE family protein phosphatase [bacterium]